MDKNRLEAFSDGVIAIIITIMVLEMKVPKGTDIAVLKPLWPVFLSYLLSYLYVGIYWNNHHHMLYTTRKTNAATLWANLHLLFWLSLFPFVTAWMGENHFAPIPTALYGIVLFMAAVAYRILQSSIIASHGQNSVLAQAIGKDRKGNLSLLFYAIAVPSALLWVPVAALFYVLVALMWLIHDRRIERLIAKSNDELA